PRCVGKRLGDPGAVRAVTFELEHRSDAGKRALPRGHAREALALPDRVRKLHAVDATERGLVVERVDVRRSAGHEEPDDAFGSRLRVRRAPEDPEVRLLTRRRPHEKPRLDEACEPEGAETMSSEAEEIAPAENGARVEDR